MWGLLQRVRFATELSVIVLGLPKTGTTALFYKLKSSMPPETKCLFEPRQWEAKHGGQGRPILAKVLIPGGDPQSFRGFKKKILIVRDPRDRMVSRALYRVYNFPEFCTDQPKVEEFLDTLRAKETSPASVSLLDLLRLGNRLTGQDALSTIVPQEEMLMAFHRASPKYFVFRYEDLVLGKFGQLDRYLGFALTDEAPNVAPDMSRVIRTKDRGDWRNWFTPEDVVYFRSQLQSSMAHFGYHDDWELAETPEIAAEHASGYVARLVADRLALEERLRQRAVKGG